MSAAWGRPSSGDIRYRGKTLPDIDMPQILKKYLEIDLFDSKIYMEFIGKVFIVASIKSNVTLIRPTEKSSFNYYQRGTPVVEGKALNL